MTFWSPIWRSANLWKSHKPPSQKGHKELLGYYMSSFFLFFRGPFFFLNIHPNSLATSFGRFFLPSSNWNWKLTPSFLFLGIFSDPGFRGGVWRQKVSGWLGARWKWCGWQSRSWNSWRLLYHSQRTDRGAWKKDSWTFSKENVDVCQVIQSDLLIP